MLHDAITEKTPSSGAARQRRYRQRKRENYLRGLRMIIAHWRYRAEVREMLARTRQDISWRSQRSGVPSEVIEAGRNGDYGLFRPEEISAIRQWLPQVSTPCI